MTANASLHGNTIAELIELGMDVTAFCHTCNRYRPLDLATLSAAFGSEMPIRRVALRLKCEACGARDCGVLVRKKPGTGRWH